MSYDPDDPTICHSCYERIEVCDHYTHINRGIPKAEWCVMCTDDDDEAD